MRKTDFTKMRVKMTDLLRTAVPATVRDIMTCSRDQRRLTTC